MAEISLQHSLGDTQVDALLGKVIQLYEGIFPGQIAGYYVEGSYADRTQVATSDIDLVLVFRQPFKHDEERKAAEQAWNQHNQESTLEVDLILTNEQELRDGVKPNLKMASLFVYGEDVCRHYPIVPLEHWTSERMHASYWLLVNVYQRPKPVQSMLDFPDPADEFYGYTNRIIRLPDGREVPCTRNLVRTTGWVATALLALQARHYVAKKRACVQLYREHIGDEWTSLLEEIETFCRDAWQYLIPDEPAAREHLRAICARTLLFERHFLLLYKDYLLKQLHTTNQELLDRAFWAQGDSPLADEEVVAALQIAC